MLESIYNNMPSSPFRRPQHQEKIIQESPPIQTQIFKYVTIKEHPLIKEMNIQILSAKRQIENPKINDKNMEYIKKSLTDVFTKCIFIEQQIVKLGEINGQNEIDMINMTSKLTELNNICSSIYNTNE